jgi:putative copper resistance protein D
VTLLAGFLDVLLSGVSLIGLSAAVGGVIYVLVVVRPLSARSPLAEAAVRRALKLVVIGSLAIAISTALLVLLIHPWALADSLGRWAIREFLTTDFAQASLIHSVLALGLAAVAFGILRNPARRAGWAMAALFALLLMAQGAWLVHAVSRLEGRESLMAVTVLHQLGAVAWAGGLIHLAGFGLLWRRTPGIDPEGPRLLARFSAVALVAMCLVLGPGLYLSWGYIGDWTALIGTGYGVMVLTKVLLLIAALILGALSFVLLRGRNKEIIAARVPAFIETEVGIGIALLFAAASLTSLPPAADVVADRAAPSEVVSRFVPKMPRLSSPHVNDLLAAAAPIDDTLSIRQPEEYAWSEYNHQTAGFFVFLMGLLAILERAGRARWARHWPLLLLGLAAFLFLRNDPRAWPLGPAGFWETMRLPDVLQHRVAVLLVVSLGVFEWLVRIGRLKGPRWRFVFPILCAVGGTLLLTHSHAMFNLKSEFLTEVTHAPMGILGVFVGWGRWLEIRLPSRDNRLPGWVWAVALSLLGLILLFYREL